MTQWRTYNYFGANRMPINELPWDSVTHILHVYMGIDTNGDVGPDLLVHTSTDIVPLISAAHSHNVKVLLCLGVLSGNNPSDTNLLNSIATNGAWSAAAKIVSVVNQHGYDGLAVDWELSTPNFAELFPTLTEFLRCLRLQLFNKILTCAAVPGPNAQLWGRSAALSYLDRLHLMTINFAPYSVGRTNHNAGLFGGNYMADYAVISVDQNVKDYLSRGTPPGKLNIVLPFYGWELFDYAGPNLAVGSHMPGTAPDREVNYTTIVNTLLPGTSQTFDAFARVPFASASTKWISYDDPVSIRAKVDYVRQRGLGGIDAHEIGAQYFPSATEKHPLWKAVADGFAATLPSGAPLISVDVDEGSLFRAPGHGQVFSGTISGPNMPAALNCYLAAPGYPETIVRSMSGVPTTGGVWSTSPSQIVGQGTYWFYVCGPSNEMLAKEKFTVAP